MKKKIDESLIQNELSQGSSFFKKKTDEPNIQSENRTSVRPYERTNVRTNVRNDEKIVRIKIRHAFDIFEDQLRQLQATQLKAVQAGERKPSIGWMVQEAIDDWLAKQDY